VCLFADSDKEQSSNNRSSKLTETADTDRDRAEGKELDRNSNLKITNDADSNPESRTSVTCEKEMSGKVLFFLSKPVDTN
jgi:hypothetical protein